jgi:uncharacterized protein (DUF3820 family)
MPFGKFKGWELSKVPGYYLEWVLKKCVISDEFRSKIEDIQRQKANCVEK